MSAPSEAIAAPALPRARPRGTAGAVARAAASLLRIGATAALELRLNLLGPAPWIIGIILAAFGYLVVRTAPDNTSFPLGWALSSGIGPIVNILILFLTASLANRPNRYDVTELLDSKVVGSEELIFGRWLGMIGAYVAPFGLLFAATIAGQGVHSRHPIDVAAYAQALLRMLPPALFLGTLSFCLVTVTRILVLGAGLSGLIWFVLNAGQPYYPTVFRMELSQNGPVFLGLTATALLGMLLTYRAGRRAKRSRVTVGLALAFALVLVSTAIGSAWLHMALPGRASTNAAHERLRTRAARRLPVPNFAWVDVSGRRTSIAALRGNYALLVFIQPKDGGLLPLLRRMAEARREFASHHLGVVAICLSEDLNGARDAARLAKADLPVVTDWGAPASGEWNEQAPPSAISWSLGISQTPQAILLDPDGRIREVQGGPIALDETGWKGAKERLRAVLEGTESDELLPTGIPGLPGGLGL
jgi:hypothetical protein